MKTILLVYTLTLHFGSPGRSTHHKPYPGDAPHKFTVSERSIDIEPKPPLDVKSTHPDDEAEPCSSW